MTDQKPQSNLMYLRRQLGFSMADWTALSEKDKADLRRMASEEMRALGLPESQAAAI